VPGDSWSAYFPSNPLATAFVPLVIYDPGTVSPAVLEISPETDWALTPIVVDMKAKQMMKTLFCICRSKYIQGEISQTLINSYTTLINSHNKKGVKSQRFAP
jgi:hypothetical protein